MRKALAACALLAAGIAASVALTTAAPAHAYTLPDLPGLGYTMYAVGEQGELDPRRGCTNYYAEGNGSPRTLIGSQDPLCTDQAIVQKRIDALVAAYPPPPPPPTTAPPVTTAAAPPTTTAPPATVTQTVVATLPAPPYADFDAALTNPDVVAFTDKSTAAAPFVSRTWQFGDGKGGVGPSLSHVYPGVGTYQVTLTVIDSNGLTSESTRQLTINADRTIVLGPRVTQAIATARPVARATVKKPAAKACVATKKSAVKKKHR